MDVLVRHNNKRHKLRIEADATLESFMRRVDALTNISPSRQVLKVGYPPQPLGGGLHRSGETRRKAASLRELGIQSNELIIVEEVPADAVAPTAEESSAAAAAPLAAAAAAGVRLRDQHIGDNHHHHLHVKCKGMETPSTMLLTKSCPPFRPALHSSGSSRSDSQQTGAGSSRPAAATAEDAYQWEEEDVAFEEEEDEEEEAVGMPLLRCVFGGGGGGGGTAAATAGITRRAETKAAAAAAPGITTTKAAASSAVAAGGSREAGQSEEQRAAAVAAKELYVGPDEVCGDQYLQCEVDPPEETAASSSWTDCRGGGGGARLLRGVVGLGSKKKSPQEAADPSIVGEAVRYVVPSDNSCLFTCLCLLAAPHATPQQLRALVGSAIDADPESFTDAVLERPRQEYIEWILSPTSWGGYVELAILAQQLQHEVVCVDVETKRKDFYGDARTGRRVYLLYDGVHYDAIVARRKCSAERGATSTTAASGRHHRSAAAVAGAAGGGVGGGGGEYESIGEEYIRVFQPTDREMEAKAAAVAAEFHRMKQFTNLQRMSMQCLVCGVGIRDQEHAREHAREYGHANFGETRR